MTKTQISSADIEPYKELVKKIAFNLRKKLPPNISNDDLIQDGYVGLIEALKKYDPSQGALFETYAGIRIHGAMLNGLRRLSFQPKSVTRSKRKLNKAACAIEMRTQKEATLEELKKEMAISSDELAKIMVESATDITTSYESDISKGVTIDAVTVGDPELLHFMRPEETLEIEEFSHLLKTGITELPERERLAIILHYAEEMNLKETGSILGISESRVCRILRQAHLRLRAKLKYYNITAA